MEDINFANRFHMEPQSPDQYYVTSGELSSILKSEYFSLIK